MKTYNWEAVNPDGYCIDKVESIRLALPAFARLFAVFFFSSRRRHTRFDCDWSSDVCSSDLAAHLGGIALLDRDMLPGRKRGVDRRERRGDVERHPVVPAEHRQRVRADLVRREIGRASCRGRV